MSGLFSPKMPAMPEPVKVPTTDDARQSEEDLMRLRKRRGLASTFLFNRPSGRPGSAGAASMLLGAAAGDSAAGGAAGSSAGGTGGGGGGGRSSAARTLLR